MSQQVGQFTIIGYCHSPLPLPCIRTEAPIGRTLCLCRRLGQEAARLAGIHPQKVTFAVFVLMGALTGLAALLTAVRFPDVDPKAGQGLELKAIAAAVVGGVAISGGRGYLWGVAAGVLLLSSIAQRWYSYICSPSGKKRFRA